MTATIRDDRRMRPMLMDNPRLAAVIGGVKRGPHGRAAILPRMFPVSDVIPSRTRPYVTMAVIAVNAAVFLYTLQLNRYEMYRLAHDWGSVPASFRWTPLVTSLFLHDSWVHAGASMLYLWLFAANVEDVLGHAGFLIFYLGAGALGALAHAAVHPGSAVPLVGASAAVAAVMGAYFVLYPRSQVLTAVFLLVHVDVVEIPAIFFLGLWVMLQVFSSLAGGGMHPIDAGIAAAAQAAGFAIGALMGVVLRRRARPWD